MNWPSLFAALAALFEKVLPLIRELLAGVNAAGAVPSTPELAVSEAFERLHAQTSWWSFRKRRQLRAARRFAIKRAPELVRQARGGPADVPPLTGAEIEALTAA